jgi:pimeloyl-ACP methyl ester carboxylesterase
VRRTIRLLGIALAVVALSAATAEAEPTTNRPPPLDWTACPEDVTVQCATLPVPIDWARPRGAKIDLALARRSATDPGARMGSLVVNLGGPGSTGVDDLLTLGDYFSDDLRRRFDIVAFDARGAGRSHPVQCSLEVLEQAPDSLLPDSQAEFDALKAWSRSLHTDCRRHTGALYDHLDTSNDAKDLDAVRAALGEDKLTFYGLSYGSMLGLQYAEEFPGRVRALAVDSVIDHSLSDARAFLDTEAVSAQDAFDEFVTWCDRDTDCALHGRNVRAFWADLMARASRGELLHPFQPDTVLTPEEMVRGAAGELRGPNWETLAQILVAIDAGGPPPGAASEGQEKQKEIVSLGSNGAMTCSNVDLSVRDFAEFRRHLRSAARLAPDMRFPPAVGLVVDCLDSTLAVSNPPHRLRVRQIPTILLVNALHDPATGYNQATSVADQLGNRGVLLTYEGWGHGVYDRSACTSDAIDRYLISLATPKRGARCSAVEPE